jgi:hypothetical protein
MLKKYSKEEFISFVKPPLSIRCRKTEKIKQTNGYIRSQRVFLNNIIAPFIHRICESNSFLWIEKISDAILKETKEFLVKLYEDGTIDYYNLHKHLEKINNIKLVYFGDTWHISSKLDTNYTAVVPFLIDLILLKHSNNLTNLDYIIDCAKNDNLDPFLNLITVTIDSKKKCEEIFNEMIIDEDVFKKYRTLMEGTTMSGNLSEDFICNLIKLLIPNVQIPFIATEGHYFDYIMNIDATIVFPNETKYQLLQIKHCNDIQYKDGYGCVSVGKFTFQKHIHLLGFASPECNKGVVFSVNDQLFKNNFIEDNNSTLFGEPYQNLISI